MADLKENVLYSKLPDSQCPSDWQEKSFVEIILNLTRKFLSNKTWLINVGGGVMTSGEIAERAFEAANYLSKRGLQKGETVHIVLGNCVEFHVTVFGVWILGGIASLADPSLTEQVLKKQVSDTKSSMLVCSTQNLDKISKVAQGQVTVVNVDDWFRKTQDIPRCPWPAKVEDDATLVIFWSSGTTGRPKGIRHGRKFLMRSLVKSSFPPDTLLQTTCFFHTGGFFAPLDGGLYNGFTVVFHSPNTTAQSILQSVDKYKPLAIVCGSHHAVQLSMMNSDHQGLDLSSVKIIAPMGAAVYSGIVADLRKCFTNMLPAVLGYYGMSEVGTICTSDSPDKLGRLAPGCQAKILGEDGILLGPLKTGEILAKTPTIMNGYVNHMDENVKFFDDPDGFVHTGDLGYYDENGFLFYHGRKKELIKYQNCHIHPIEIEDVGLKHPEIDDIGVYGVPDPKVQELVSAVVVPKKNSVLTENEVADYINKQLEDFKHIRGPIKFVETIPRNPQGKILRSNLFNL